MGAKASTQQPVRPRSDTFPHGSSSSGSSILLQQSNGSANGNPHYPTSSSSSRSNNFLGVRSSTPGASEAVTERSGSRRARSMSAVSPGEMLASRGINGNSGSDSDDSSPEVDGHFPFFRIPGSLPLRLFQLTGIKCPVCGKQVASDNVECHLVECLTKPRIVYNEDVLTEVKGECVICFDEMDAGQTIARLPCLCIYHKRCIDSWFRVNRSCPEHPGD